ncbi:MAG: hypothetical protein ACT4QC_05645 [Planctomycetaceae bacterium]
MSYNRFIPDPVELSTWEKSLLSAIHPAPVGRCRGGLFARVTPVTAVGQDFLNAPAHK